MFLCVINQLSNCSANGNSKGLVFVICSQIEKCSVAWDFRVIVRYVNIWHWLILCWVFLEWWVELPELAEQPQWHPPSHLVCGISVSRFLWHNSVTTRWPLLWWCFELEQLVGRNCAIWWFQQQLSSNQLASGRGSSCWHLCIMACFEDV